eukprot:scaffold422998_cov63-Attheya_sp.AAC.2
MAKKNRKNKSNKKGTKSRPSVVRAGESTADFKYALRTCSFDRLRAFYLDLWPMVEVMSQEARRVTDAAMNADRVTTRAIIERQLGAISVAEPFPLLFRNQIENQLRSMGGIKISTVLGTGDVEQRLCGFAYTIGFTAVGGKELLIQNVHRSVISPSIIGPLFNWLYKRHNEGHPLAHGSTITFGEIVYKVEAPADRVEATLIKASKMQEPTRLYGLAGYDILLIIPVGTRLADADENRSTTHEEVITPARGCETGDGGFRPEPNAANLRICAWCHKSTAALENKKVLKKCSGCNNSFYCSREHQKLHWKEHKADCMRSDEEMFKISMGISDTTLEGAHKTDGGLSDEERFKMTMCQSLDSYMKFMKSKKE